MSNLVKVAVVGQNRAVKAGDIAWVYPVGAEPVLIRALFSEDDLVEGGNIPVHIHLCEGKFEVGDWIWNSSQNKIFQATQQAYDRQHEVNFLIKIVASTNIELEVARIYPKSKFVKYVIEKNGEVPEAYLEIKKIEARNYIDDDGVRVIALAHKVAYVSTTEPTIKRTPLDEAAHVYAIEEVCKKTGFEEGSGQWRSKYNTAVQTFLAGAAYTASLS